MAHDTRQRDAASRTTLRRSMETRHVRMIALGGVIGTGLFVSSGYTIHQAGPFGTILAYAIGGLIVYLVMLCLGELSVAMPVSGSFHVYATRYIGPATGFVVAIQYWITWTVALGSEFTAAGLLMQRWFPHTPAWVWSAICIVVVFIVNALSVRFFAETEFWFSSVKVAAIVVFMLVGVLAITGVISISGHDHAPWLSNVVDGGLFPNGFAPVFATILTVNFAFSGTELVAVTAGETRDPRTAVPKAIHTTLWRLLVFFIGSIVVMSALIPWQDAGVDESPFVMVFSAIGLPYAGDIMNAVVLTALLSASNSGLYAATRMVWSLGNEGMLPRCFAATNRHGAPVLALCVSMAGGLLALLSSVVAASSVYLILVGISGLSAVVVWAVVAWCQIRFRKQWLRDGHTLDELPYRTPGFPVVSWLAFGLCVLSCVLVALDPEQWVALVSEIIFIALCYGLYWLNRKRIAMRGE